MSLTFRLKRKTHVEQNEADRNPDKVNAVTKPKHRHLFYNWIADPIGLNGCRLGTFNFSDYTKEL